MDLEVDVVSEEEFTLLEQVLLAAEAKRRHVMANDCSSFPVVKREAVSGIADTRKLSVDAGAPVADTRHGMDGDMPLPNEKKRRALPDWMSGGRDRAARAAALPFGRPAPPAHTPNRMLPEMRFPGQVLYARTLAQVDAACRDILAWSWEQVVGTGGSDNRQVPASCAEAGRMDAGACSLAATGHTAMGGEATAGTALSSGVDGEDPRCGGGRGQLAAVSPTPRTVTVGFDIEWRVTFQAGAPPPKASVIQICPLPTTCYVLHLAPALGAQLDEGGPGGALPESLLQVLTCHHIQKAGVGVGGDSMKLRRDFRVDMTAVVDLGAMARGRLMPQGGVGAGGPGGGGLSALVEKVLGARLDKPKGVRLSNWDAAPLSRTQLHYAATDAFASLALYQALERLPLLPAPAPCPRAMPGVGQGSKEGPASADDIKDGLRRGDGTAGEATTAVLFVGVSPPLPPTGGLIFVELAGGTLGEHDKGGADAAERQHEEGCNQPNGRDGSGACHDAGRHASAVADALRDGDGQLAHDRDEHNPLPPLSGCWTPPCGHAGAQGGGAGASVTLAHGRPSVQPVSVQRIGKCAALRAQGAINVAGGGSVGAMLAARAGTAQLVVGDASRTASCSSVRTRGVLAAIQAIQDTVATHDHGRQSTARPCGHHSTAPARALVDTAEQRQVTSTSPRPDTGEGGKGTWCDHGVAARSTERDGGTDDKENGCPCREVRWGQGPARLIETVKAHAGEPATVPADASPTTPVSGLTRLQPAKMAVYELHWRQGMGVREISEARHIRLDTVMGYLAEAVAGGWPYAWHRLGIDDRQLDSVVRALALLATVMPDTAASTCCPSVDCAGSHVVPSSMVTSAVGALAGAKRGDVSSTMPRDNGGGSPSADDGSKGDERGACWQGQGPAVVWPSPALTCQCAWQGHGRLERRGERCIVPSPVNAGQDTPACAGQHVAIGHQGVTVAACVQGSAIPLVCGAVSVGPTEVSSAVWTRGVWVDLERVSIKDVIDVIPPHVTLSYAQARLVLLHLRRLAALIAVSNR